MKKKIYILLIGIIGIHLFLLTLLKFTAWPEMLLWPYLWIHNLWPYKDIAIAHTPLMLADLAIFFKIFGVGILQLKIFTWILILFMDVSVFYVAKKLWNVKTAFLSLVAFSLWMMFFDGNGLWFDLYVGLLAFCSFYFVRQKKWFWAGFLWAMAMLSKQTAVWFLIPIGLELVQSTKYLAQSLKKFIFGVAGILTVFILLLFTFNLLPSFYDWAIKFGIFVLPNAIGQIQLPDIKNLAVAVFPFLIFIPLIWKTGKKNLNLALWALAGCLGAYPRFEYFHIQPAIPFLAIATGMVFANFEKQKGLVKSFLIIYLIGSTLLFGGFFMRSFKEGVRFYEQDVRDLVLYVKSNTNPGDKIFVMNWWDNIYALTGTMPATDPWVPQLSWYQEVPSVQEKEVTDLKNSKPKLILLQNYSETGLSSYKPQKVYNYVMTNYKFKEKVDGIEILVPNK